MDPPPTVPLNAPASEPCYLDAYGYECPYKDTAAYACPYLHETGISEPMTSLTAILPTELMAEMEEHLAKGTKPPWKNSFVDFFPPQVQQTFTKIDVDSASSPLECSICMEEVSSPIGVLQNCDHFFCHDCLKSWAFTFKRLDCPFCRTTFNHFMTMEPFIPTGAFRSVIFAYTCLQQYICRRVRLQKGNSPASP